VPWLEWAVLNPRKGLAMGGRKQQDFPPGLAGGLEHDDEDHRLGETGQTGPESPGDINRGHPEQQPAPVTDQGADKPKPRGAA